MMFSPKVVQYLQFFDTVYISIYNKWISTVKLNIGGLFEIIKWTIYFSLLQYV